jgi:hypothetical protein
MTQAQERRAQGTSRVPLETLVEICGNEPGIPAFEAQALDVSAQGMHLRTAYLPDEGAPLVCRFEDRGREIVVEGVVAWRKESAKGGDFGVAFTALDSRSVDALKALIKTGAPSDKAAPGEGSGGARVRLHIEGLGSPMKARIRTGGGQKIQVGSSLEFLKMGRKLELEDLEAGGRRTAQIDGVEVVIDPRTSVPQLVVALRFASAPEDTPEPSVTDLGADCVRPQSLRIAPEAVTLEPARDADAGDPAPSGDAPRARNDDEGDEDDDEEFDSAVPATTRAARKLGHAAENAGSVARDASVAAARWGSATFGQLFAGASAKLAALRGQKAAPPKRRTTAKPADTSNALDAKRLRPQSSTKSAGDAAEPEAAPARKSKRAAIAIAVAAVSASAGVIALRPATGSKPVSTATAAGGLTTDVTRGAAPLAAPGVTALAPGVTALPGAGSITPSGALGAPGTIDLPAPPPGSPVTANVPLFGPTPLATTEPAPLGPPPTAATRGLEAEELSAAKAVTPPTASDEEFADPIEHVDGSKKKAEGKSADGKSTRPEDVPAWGKGKMHLPTVHRLRLDGPGSELHGVSDATGFTVLVPGRKIMEQGDGIMKRDPRIGRARTTNTPGGAQVRITFRETLPAYRVRLRRDYIELLISAPEEPVSSKPSSRDGKSAKEAKAGKDSAKLAAKTTLAARSIPARH